MKKLKGLTWGLIHKNEGVNLWAEGVRRLGSRWFRSSLVSCIFRWRRASTPRGWSFRVRIGTSQLRTSSGQVLDWPDASEDRRKAASIILWGKLLDWSWRRDRLWKRLWGPFASSKAKIPSRLHRNWWSGRPRLKLWCSCLARSRFPSLISHIRPELVSAYEEKPQIWTLSNVFAS